MCSSDLALSFPLNRLTGEQLFCFSPVHYARLFKGEQYSSLSSSSIGTSSSAVGFLSPEYPGTSRASLALRWEISVPLSDMSYPAVV